MEKPAVVIPALVAGEERKELEDALADEAASDPPTEEENEGPTSHPVTDDALLAELAAGSEQLDTEVEQAIALPLPTREDRPEFEEAGSPSKLPRRTVGLVSVLRTEKFPDNDVHSDDEEWFGDDEFYDYSENESDWEFVEDPAERREQPVRVLPREFFDEEAGPPQVSEEQLEEIDDEAAEKEVTRLTKMNVIEEVDLEEQDDESIWLTTKLVFDWRFREAENVVQEQEEGVPEAESSEKLKPKRVWQRRARLVAREYNNSKREDIFSPATSPSITKLIPILALFNGWSIWSLDIKDAFLQVPQKRPVKCKVPYLVKEMRVFCGAIFAAIFWSKKVLKEASQTRPFSG